MWAGSNARLLFMNELAVLIERIARSAFSDELAPGGGILIATAGGVLFSGGFGCANLLSAARVIPTTNFRLASVSKQFTAFCVMLLEAEGRVRLDGFLRDYVPGLPAFAHSVTVRHVLHHTSGLPPYEDFVQTTIGEQVHDRDVPALIGEATGLLFVPGTQYRYSNSGYALLALLVEECTGMSFASFLRQRIFAPLGMAESVAFEDGVSTVANRAFGYREENGAFVPADQSPTSAVLGDGGIYSSLVDYLKWDRALYTESLLPAHKLARAYEPGRLNSGESVSYGFGWRLETAAAGHRIIHHTGETCGFNACVRRVPDRRLLTVVLCNRRGHLARHLALQIEALVLEAGR